MISIFCDGACSGNGQAGAAAGWAWARWEGEVVGEPDASGAGALEGSRATNQRAELTALLRAMEGVDAEAEAESVTIYSDSLYAINCASVWGPQWRTAEWTRASKKPLENLDLIQPLVALWDTHKVRVRLVHVRGHQTGTGPLVHGNTWVDRAAVNAIGSHK